MKFISKLNMTTKVIILAVYTMILLFLAIIIGSRTKTTYSYESFGTTPGDENIDICLRIKERRVIGSGDTKEGQYWDFQVYLHFKNQEAVYRNVNCYLTIKTKGGDYKYNEKLATIVTGINNGSSISSSISDRSYFSSYGFTSKSMTLDASGEGYIKNDGEPDVVYLLLTYDVRQEDGSLKMQEISYKCNIINADSQNFSKYEETSCLVDETKNPTYVDLKIENSPIQLKTRTTLATSESTDTNATNDVFRFNVYYNPVDSDAKNNIKNVSLAMFLGAVNTSNDDEEYFNNYIEVLHYYGALPYLYTIPQVSASYDENYEINKLYVYTEILKEDNKIETSKISISVNNLPVY